MYRSTSYASQGSKTAFVEMAQRSAKAAQLLQEAGVAQQGQRPKQLGTVARRAASKVDHLMEGLRGTMTRSGAGVQG
jgi:hypothetical protein